jgi:hypothetical protein
MNADVTDRILKGLEQARAQSPELRFGQLVAILGELAADETGFSLWDVEDLDFAAALDRFAADLARRGSGSSEPAAAPDRGGIAASGGSAVCRPPRPVS